MNQTQNTPAWVQPVDGATCAALARELWAMLSAAGADSSVVDFCDYITSATLAFQRVHAHSEWGVTHDWMEETEAFLVRYLREFPIRGLTDPDPYVERQLRDYEAQQAAVRAVSHDEAEAEALAMDALRDDVGARLAVALDKQHGIRCRHYGDGVIEVDWSRPDADLRVCVYIDDINGEPYVDVESFTYGQDGSLWIEDVFGRALPAHNVAVIATYCASAQAEADTRLAVG